MWAACLLIPHLPVRVERRRDLALSHRPLIIGGRRWDKGAVLDCCPQALNAGVEPGMRLSRAEALCPEARFLPADDEAYEKIHHALIEGARTFTPTVETDRLGLVYADISGLKRRFDDDAHATQKLIEETFRAAASDVQIGVGSGKFAARQAAQAAKPGEACLVSSGQEKAFLSSLDISVLPIDPEMEQRLRLLGVRTLGALAQLPRLAVLRQFGSSAGAAYDLACGKDTEPVHADAPPLRLVRSHSFIDPVGDRAPLLAHLERMLDGLTTEIDRRGYQAEGLRLTIEEIGGDELDVGKPIKPPSSDADQLSRLVACMLESINISGPAVSLSLTLYPLRPFHSGAHQLSLFDSTAVSSHTAPATFGGALQEALRRLRDRFGEFCILVASLVVAPSPRPIHVTTDPDGLPRAIVWHERIWEVSTLYEHWRERRHWWGRPIERDYYRLEIADGSTQVTVSSQSFKSTQSAGSTPSTRRIKVVFRDVQADQWYLERRHI